MSHLILCDGFDRLVKYMLAKTSQINFCDIFDCQMCLKFCKSLIADSDQVHQSRNRKSEPAAEPTATRAQAEDAHIYETMGQPDEVIEHGLYFIRFAAFCVVLYRGRLIIIFFFCRIVRC